MRSTRIPGVNPPALDPQIEAWIDQQEATAGLPSVSGLEMTVGLAAKDGAVYRTISTIGSRQFLACEAFLKGLGFSETYSVMHDACAIVYRLG